MAGVATSTVNELTRVAIVGGKMSWANVAIGGIQGGIYGYAEGLGRQSGLSAMQTAKNSTNITTQKQFDQLPVTGSKTLDLNAKFIIREKLSAGDYDGVDIDNPTKKWGGFGPATASFEPSVLPEGGNGSEINDQIRSLPEIDYQPSITGAYTQSASMGWDEAMNPNNMLGQRLIFGGLSLAATPVAMVESLLLAPANVVPAARELGQTIAVLVCKQTHMSVIRTY